MLYLFCFGHLNLFFNSSHLVPERERDSPIVQAWQVLDLFFFCYIIFHTSHLVTEREKNLPSQSLHPNRSHTGQVWVYIWAVCEFSHRFSYGWFIMGSDWGKHCEYLVFQIHLTWYPDVTYMVPGFIPKGILIYSIWILHTLPGFSPQGYLSQSMLCLPRFKKFCFTCMIVCMRSQAWHPRNFLIYLSPPPHPTNTHTHTFFLF